MCVFRCYDYTASCSVKELKKVDGFLKWHFKLIVSLLFLRDHNIDAATTTQTGITLIRIFGIEHHSRRITFYIL